MAFLAVTLRVMPASPDVDLAQLRGKVEEKLVAIGANLGTFKEEPIAFGLKALIFVFRWKEDQDPDVIETEVAKLENVNSVQITEARRMLG